MDKLTMIVSAKIFLLVNGGKFTTKTIKMIILLTQFEENIILFYSDFSTNNRLENDFDMVVGLIILSENCNRK